MKIFICSRYSAQTDEEKAHNLKIVKAMCREARNQGHLPLAPHLYFTQFLEDGIPADREAGMQMGRIWLEECQALWYDADGSMSEGMQGEIALALKLRRQITPVATNMLMARHAKADEEKLAKELSK